MKKFLTEVIKPFLKPLWIFIRIFVILGALSWCIGHMDWEDYIELTMLLVLVYFSVLTCGIKELYKEIFIATATSKYPKLKNKYCKEIESRRNEYEKIKSEDEKIIKKLESLGLCDVINKEITEKDWLEDDYDLLVQNIKPIEPSIKNIEALLECARHNIKKDVFYDSMLNFQSKLEGNFNSHEKKHCDMQKIMFDLIGISKGFFQPECFTIRDSKCYGDYLKIRLTNDILDKLVQKLLDSTSNTARKKFNRKYIDSSLHNSI